MREIRFLYRCRMCGGIDNSLETGGGDGIAAMHLAGAIYGKPQSTMEPTLLTLHHCEEGKTGIADLIGAEERP